MVFSEKIFQRAHALQQAYPFAHIEIIGTSRMGKPLYALVIGRGARALGYNAAHHANEWITALLLMQFVEELCEARAAKPQILDDITLYAVPLVNPDGADGVISEKYPPHWKANACGVDLNANYPASWEVIRARNAKAGYGKPGPRGFPGMVPLCEPESSAMAAYTRLREFSLTISLHTQGEEIYHRYRHYDPPGADALAAEMAQASGYAITEVPEESAHGGYRDWFIERFKRPGFTLECGLGENPLPLSDFDAVYADVAPMLWVPLSPISSYISGVCGGGAEEKV